MLSCRLLQEKAGCRLLYIYIFFFRAQCFNFCVQAVKPRGCEAKLWQDTLPNSFKEAPWHAMPCRHGMPYCGIYSASKAAVQNLTEALRLELQPFKVAVVYVAPGVTASDMSNTKNFLVGLDFMQGIVVEVRGGVSCRGLWWRCAGGCPRGAQRLLGAQLRQPDPHVGLCAPLCGHVPAAPPACRVCLRQDVVASVVHAGVPAQVGDGLGDLQRHGAQLAGALMRRC